jgi:hypothetical protein
MEEKMNARELEKRSNHHNLCESRKNIEKNCSVITYERIINLKLGK